MSSYNRGIVTDVRTEVLSSLPFEIHDLEELIDIGLLCMFCQKPDLSGHVRWTFRCVPVGLLGFPVVPVRNGVVGLKAEDARPRPKDVPSE